MMSSVDLADETPGGGGEPDAGLLGRLPRKRPQNASRRRASTRAAAETNGNAPTTTRASRAVKAARDDTAPATRNARAPRGRQGARSRRRAPPPKRRAKQSEGQDVHREERSDQARRRESAHQPRERARGSPHAAAPRQHVRPPVPPQGYESDGDRAQGIVSPPGGADFAATAFEALGEITRFSLSAGERLVRDLLGRRS